MYGTATSGMTAGEIRIYVIDSSSNATGSAYDNGYYPTTTVAWANHPTSAAVADVHEVRWQRGLKRCLHPIWWHYQRRREIPARAKPPALPQVRASACRRSTGQASAWRCRRAPWAP